MPRAPKGKLRNRIFLVILIGLVPIVVATALGISAVQSSHREDVARLEAAVLTQTAEEVEHYVDENILAHPRLIAPTGVSINTTSAQQFALSETMSFYPFIESESFVTMAGQESVHLDRTHPAGYPADELRDMSSTPEFRTAEAGNYYFGPVSYPPAGPSVSFSAPVTDDAGNIIGVTVGEANLDEVQTIVADAKIGSTGYLYLIDAQGNVIGGGGPEGAVASATTTSAANLPIVQKVLGGSDLLTADTQMQYRNAAGDSVIAAATYLPAPLGWGLVAEWPTSEANSIVNVLFVRNAMMLGIVFLIVFAASLFLAAYVVRPVKKLRERAERVAQGNFDEGVSIKTGDELEELGESFNDMVQGLKELQALKDEFVFIAAHELRTPVAAMKGYLSLILDGTTGGVNDATKQYIEKVIASDNRLVQLVNDLLEVARSEAGRLTVAVSPIDITQPIHGVLDELKSLADQKSVTMVYQPDTSIPKVLADADRIKEVMVNLVGNAIKYMGGPGTVTITHEVQGGVLLTHVADTGLGISPEAQKKLFEKFYRVQTEKTRDITGTGLGLFIVREIVEKMGGKIWATSEEGRGSTFSFSLPITAE